MAAASKINIKCKLLSVQKKLDIIDRVTGT